MSANAPSPHHDTPSGHDHAPAHGSFKGYMTGFVLSVILTAIPFWLVMDHVISSVAGADVALLGLAVVQIFVHMVYFLHMNTRSEGGWSMLALIFTLVLVLITLIGSIWVMYHLNANMMPMTPAQALQQP
ncbi:MAG: cytochrome o ubiquinol oxidase subunit IV [Sphingomonas sp.]